MLRIFTIAAAASLVLAACAQNYALVPVGPPSLAPTSLAFLGVGGALAQTVTVSETNYSGVFTVTSANCSGIASTSASSSSGAFSITPLGAGSCSFTFTDGQQKTVALPVSVTVTVGGGE